LGGGGNVEPCEEGRKERKGEHQTAKKKAETVRLAFKKRQKT